MDKRDMLKGHTIKHEGEAPSPHKRFMGGMGFMLAIGVVIVALGFRNNEIDNVIKKVESGEGGTPTASQSASIPAAVPPSQSQPPPTKRELDYLADSMASGRWSLELADEATLLAQRFQTAGGLEEADYLELLGLGAPPDSAPPELLAALQGGAAPEEMLRYQMGLAGAYFGSRYSKACIAGELTLTVGGDLSLLPPTDKNALYLPLKDCGQVFGNDTFTILNIEGMLNDATAAGLYAGQVDAVNIANEHTGQDPGTAAALGKAGVGVFGGHTNWIENRGGITTAFLGYDLLDKPEMNATFTRDIAAAKAEGAQLVVVYLHWESAGEQPTEYQQSTARQAIDAGAQLVVGSHPDTVQGMEQYKGSTIAYSLGSMNSRGVLYRQQFSLDSLGAVVPGEFLIIPLGWAEKSAPRPLFGSEAQSVTNQILQRSKPLPDGIRELHRWSAE